MCGSVTIGMKKSIDNRFPVPILVEVCCSCCYVEAAIATTPFLISRPQNPWKMMSFEPNKYSCHHLENPHFQWKIPMFNGKSWKSTMFNGKSTMFNGKSTMFNGKSTMFNGKSTMFNGKSTMFNGKSPCSMGKVHRLMVDFPACHLSLLKPRWGCKRSTAYPWHRPKPPVRRRDLFEGEPPGPVGSDSLGAWWVGLAFSSTRMFPKMVGFPPKSSILIGFSIINHSFWGTTIFGKTHKVEVCQILGVIGSTFEGFVFWTHPTWVGVQDFSRWIYHSISMVWHNNMDPGYVWSNISGT